MLKDIKKYQPDASETVVVSLPASLQFALEDALFRQAISLRDASARLICGLSGLTDADLRSLSEPPREVRNTTIALPLTLSELDRLSEASRVSRLALSSILRRIFYATLITRRVRFRSTKSGIGFQLEMTQLCFEFADRFECDGPQPLLSRPYHDRERTRGY